VQQLLEQLRHREQQQEQEQEPGNDVPQPQQDVLARFSGDTQVQAASAQGSQRQPPVLPKQQQQQQRPEQKQQVAGWRLQAISAAGMFEVSSGTSKTIWAAAVLLSNPPTNCLLLLAPQPQGLSAGRCQLLPAASDLDELEGYIEGLYDEDITKRAAAAAKIAVLFSDIRNMEVRLQSPLGRVQLSVWTSWLDSFTGSMRQMEI